MPSPKMIRALRAILVSSTEDLRRFHFLISDLSLSKTLEFVGDQLS